MSETLTQLFRRKADPTPATPNASLFEQLGGEAAVGTAVDIFYRKVMADARINYFFFGVNITEQAAKQKAFLGMAFGGPHEYTGRDMRRSHAKLVGMGLNDRHFDIVLDHLRDTLRDLESPEPLIQQVIAICESTRDDILGRKPRESEGTAPNSRNPRAAAASPRGIRERSSRRQVRSRVKPWRRSSRISGPCRHPARFVKPQSSWHARVPGRYRSWMRTANCSAW